MTLTKSDSLRPIAICVGTRPEIIKMAPVYHALRQAGLPVMLVHSGQHDSMAWPLYEFFGMKPDLCIELERTGTSLAHLSARLLDRIGGALENLALSTVLVHGDTSTAAMTALCGFYRQTPVGHVEAGLRTHDRYDPFPEEMNRALIARIATWHFAPTQAAVANLTAEGIRDGVHQVGNTAIDAARWACERLTTYWQEHPERFPTPLAPLREASQGRRLLVVTAHRRENWGEGIEQIAASVCEWLARHPEYVVAWPVHANPQVGRTVRETIARAAPDVVGRVILTEPLDYPAMVWLMQRAWLMLTDSGGIQEEAAALDKPILVLRETTERPELIDAGRGLLTGARKDRILRDLAWLHDDPAMHARMSSGVNPFGDGRTAGRIAATLAHDFGVRRAAA